MLHLILVICLFGGCTLCGLFAGARLRDRTRSLDALRADIRRLTLLMAYAPEPLTALTLRIADGSTASFWRALSAQLQRAPEVREGWKRAMQQVQAEENAYRALREPEQRILLDYAAELGASGRYTQQENARLLEERLCVIAEQAREEYLRKGKMYRMMGVLCGAAASLLVL